MNKVTLAVAVAACAVVSGRAAAQEITTVGPLTIVTKPGSEAGTPAQIDLRSDSTCRPDYPQAAARAGAQGTTGLLFTVDAEGHVIGAEIVRSSGPTREHRLLDIAARSDLSTCPFKPGKDASRRPATTRVVVNYTWVLDR